MSIDRLSISFLVCLEEGHKGGNRLCLVESLDLACVSNTLLSVPGSPKMIVAVAVAPPWPPLSSIDGLSILFPARMEEGHRARGGNRLCLVGSLGLACI